VDGGFGREHVEGPATFRILEACRAMQLAVAGESEGVIVAAATFHLRVGDADQVRDGAGLAEVERRAVHGQEAPGGDAPCVRLDHPVGGDL
jgi:hypothetical protein